MPDYRIVDVFAEAKYAGNPLAVVLDAGALPSETMQAIAREFGFSETTFVTGRESAGCRVRIFTPTAEIPFAGHPTLGTAAVLRSEYGLGDAVTLCLDAGEVPVQFDADGVVWLDSPPPVLGVEHPRAPVAEALGLHPGDLAPDLPVQEVSVGIGFLFVPLTGLDALGRAAIETRRLAALRASTKDAIGVYLFCRESHEPGHDLAARMLFEAGGVKEDPATGSASACLGAYALAHRAFGAGAVELRAEQGYEMGRPSLVRIHARADGDRSTIRVGGRVVDVATGRLAEEG